MVDFKKWSYLSLSFLIVSFTIAIIATTSNPATPRIIGGQDAPDGKYPYMVSLRNPKDWHFCGGSIIHKRWILTAAHCLTNQWNNSVTVIAGTNLISGGEEEVYESEYIKIHEKYYPSWIRNDIALIRVSRDIKFNSKVRPIKLPKRNINKPNYRVTMTGWGYEAQTGGVPNKLQEITLKIVDQNECQKKIAYTLSDSQICTFTKFGEGVCRGDSGSPLVADRVQIGIASFIIAECAGGNPDVFVRVYSYLRWIKTQMRNFK